MARDHNLVKIGEFAELADASVRTLRYYEELGLLRPACRGRGGVRYFDRIQLDRITAIRRLQRLGLSLEWMARTLFESNGPVDGPELLARIRAGLRHQIVLTKLRNRSLRVDLQELEKAYQRLAEQCAECDIPFSRDNCDPCPGDEEPLSAVVRALL